MKIDEFRRRMEQFWQDADQEAASLKDSYHALELLHNLYIKFDGAERAMADEVISEWVLFESEKMRFDALALIDDFCIERAMPALHDLAIRLSTSSTPGAPYELDKVNRIIHKLRVKGDEGN